MNDGYVVTTMTNPDGTVTVRRKVMNPDGSFTIHEEEQPAEEVPSYNQVQEVDESPEVHLNDASDSVSSITDMKTSVASGLSSKDDVFAGIEDSPLRTKRQDRSKPGKVAEPKPSSIHVESNMQTPLPPAYQSAMPPTRALNETPQAEKAKPPPNAAAGRIAPPSPVDDWKFQHLRENGPLLDTPSVAQLDAPVTVTIFKKNLDDRIGINVGLSRVEYKDRLIVTKISRHGLLADSAIEEGDVIMSINEHSFLDNPHTDDALAIVTQTLGRITFEVQKRGKKEGEEIENAPSPIRTTEKTIKGEGKVVTSEVLNGDGSLTIVVDHIDENGERIQREIRRERHNADNGEIMMSPSNHPGPFFQPREMQAPDQEAFPFGGDRFMQPYTDPVPVHNRQPRRKKPAKEKKVVVQKKEKTEKLGIKLELHEGEYNILIVTGVHPSGLVAAAYTPLEVGDVIVSINGFDFMENASLEIANTIIRNTVGEIIIYAVDVEDNFDGFSKVTSVTEPETPFSSFGDFRNDMAFDESSYGGSIGGYMPSRAVRITKTDPSESVGLKLVQQRSHWGLMLVVLEVSGRALQSGINVGDAILTINGVSFRGNPDLHRAELVLNNAADVVMIEFQRITEMNAALPAPRNKKAERSHRRHPAPNTEIDNRISKSIDQFDATYATFQTQMTTGPPKPTGNFMAANATRPTGNSMAASTARPTENSMNTRTDPQNSKRPAGSGPSKERAPTRGTKQNVDALRPQYIPPISNTVIVRVQKDFPQQDVGLKLEAINGLLYVTRVSLQGLFVGKSIVPGDIVLSINKKWFLDRPNAAEAEAVMRKATKVIVVECRKAPAGADGADDTKQNWLERIQCYKRSGAEV